MKSPSRLRVQTLSLLLVTVAFSLPSPAAGLDVKQAYARKATWAETMIATRANCGEWINEAKPKESQLVGTPLRAVWARIAKDWPAQCAWFARDLPRNRHLDWFLHARDVSFERWLFSLITKRLGEPNQYVNWDLEELQKEKALPGDPRWLDLYGRVNRFEEIVTITRKLWLGDLRNDIEFVALNVLCRGTLCEEPGWTELKEHAAKCADAGPAAHVGSVRELRAAIGALSAAMPSRFAGGDALRKQLDELEPKWNDIILGVSKQDAKAMEQLPVLYGEVRAFRRSLLLAVRGMNEFLGTWSRVGLEQEWEEQFASLQRDLGNRAHFDAVAPETFRQESLVLPGDRDPADIVLRRTAALLADLRTPTGSGDTPVAASSKMTTAATAVS
ncbi:MAG: hypothetical protein HZA91_05160, partial [Verrucomicrobia bacterium]|nr:hypothetical protein [Verrucomicrobiota bacterium]